MNIFLLLVYAGLLYSQLVESYTNCVANSAQCQFTSSNPLSAGFYAKKYCSDQNGRLSAVSSLAARNQLINLMIQWNLPALIVGLDCNAQRIQCQFSDNALLSDLSLWENPFDEDKLCAVLVNNGNSGNQQVLRRVACSEQYLAVCDKGTTISSREPQYEWTSWISQSTPTGNYEEENLHKIRTAYPTVCKSPEAVQCRVYGDVNAEPTDYQNTGDYFLQSCTTDGIICNNDNKRCYDYEIRFFCPSEIDECQSQGFACDANSKCVNTHGSYKCVCNFGYELIGGSCVKAAHCSAQGQQFYESFDGRTMNYFGVCRYRFTETCELPVDSSLPHFSVDIIHEDPLIPSGKSIALTIGSYTFQLLNINQEEILKVNNDQQTLPFSINLINDVQVNAEIFVDFIQVEASIGVRIRLYRNLRVEVTVSDRFFGKLCGLCGNYDNDPRNDLLLASTLITATSLTLWGNSYKTTYQNAPSCSNIDRTLAGIFQSDSNHNQAAALCQQLKLNTLFQAAWDILDPYPYYQSCIYDQYNSPGNREVACAAFNNYAIEAAKYGVDIAWRVGTGCSPQCRENEHFEEEWAPCENSCDNVYAAQDCPYAITRGCICDSQFLRSDGSCVASTSCGCLDEDRNYRNIGEEWFTNNCTVKKRCEGPRNISVHNDIQCNGDCRRLGNLQSYDCVCSSGNCISSSNCQQNNQQCDVHAVCSRVNNGYGCVCLSGYEGDGYNSCKDINECTTNRNNCSPKATCYNTDGSFQCVCNAPYVGDGVHCNTLPAPVVPNPETDCSYNRVVTCDDHAYCVDVNNTFVCECKEGSKGNGQRGSGGCDFGQCPSSYWMSLDGYCYYPTPTTGTQENLSKVCQQNGGELATLVDNFQAEFIVNLLRTLGGTENFYMGYSRLRFDDEYFPDDSSASSIQIFNDNDNNSNNNLNCTAINSTTGNYHLFKVNCASQLKGLCKIPKSPPRCPDGWVVYNNRSCVALMPDSKDYISAQMKCARYGADLLTYYGNEKSRNLLISRFFYNLAEGSFWVNSSLTCSTVGLDGSVSSDSCKTNHQFFCERPFYIQRRCPGNSEYFNGFCYTRTQAKSKSDAEDICETVGGQLVSIHSYNEQMFIKSYLNGADAVQHHWIGLAPGNDNRQYWSDTTPVDYLNWNTHYDVSNETGSCTIVYAPDFAWVSTPCSGYYPGLCKFVNTPCDNSSDCFSTYGECYLGQCRCISGYIGDGRDKCFDKNECSDMYPYPCPSIQNCANLNGSFICTCPNGTTKQGDLCVGSNYCTKKSDCDVNGECNLATNTCFCNPGYNNTAGKFCQDIDECNMTPSKCQPNAICKNLPGSYNCSCDIENNYIPNIFNPYQCISQPRTCHDIWLLNSSAPSATYYVDPDGVKGPIPNISVSCIMRADMGITLVKPNNQNFQPITNKTSLGQVVEIIYQQPAPIPYINGIVAASDFCYQYVEYQCKGSVDFLSNSEIEGGGGSKSRTWGLDVKEGSCECGLTKCCRNFNSSCNCDGTEASYFVSDSGKITNKRLLPLRYIRTGLGSISGNSAQFKVNILYCGPRPFDFPKSCADYSSTVSNYQGPLRIKPGNGDAFPVCCDRTVTIVNHNRPNDRPPQTPGYYPGPLNDPPPYNFSDGPCLPLNYNLVSLPSIQELMNISLYCTQEVSLKCKTGQITDTGSLSNPNGPLNYYPGGNAGQCACGAINQCENTNSPCNCDGQRNSIDFGFIRNKTDLPLVCIAKKPTDPNSPPPPVPSVGPLMCSSKPFGLEPTCVDWGYRGYVLNKPNVFQVAVALQEPPILLLCDPNDFGSTVVTPTVQDISTKCANATLNSPCCLTVSYANYTPTQLKSLTGSSDYCIQNISYSCRDIIMSFNKTSWKTINNQNRYYFDGSNSAYSGCSCGINKNCPRCYCDVKKSDEIQTDSGQLQVKTDLPVTQICIMYDSKNPNAISKPQLGPLKCYNTPTTCAVRASNFRASLGTPVLPSMKVLVDGDGPGGDPPTTATCNSRVSAIWPTISGPDSYNNTNGSNVGPNSVCYDVKYQDTTLSQILKIINSSLYCTQYGRLVCRNAKKTGYITLYGSGGQEIPGWFGNGGGSKCACGETGTCLNPNLDCNCDASTLTESTVDHGVFVDKSLLPITRYCIGFTDGDQPRNIDIYITPLQCADTQFNLDLDCQRISDNFDANYNKPGHVDQLIPQTWMIDPDGYGGEKPFPVFCNFTQNPAVGVTNIYAKESCTDPLNNDAATVNYNYPITSNQLASLKKVSTFCEQSLEYSCNNAPLYLDDNRNGAFGYDGTRFSSWGTNGCTNGNCQCDATDSQNHSDIARFYEWANLPISKVGLPKTTGNRTLCPGPLKCYSLYPSCQASRNASRLNSCSGNAVPILPSPELGYGPLEVTCKPYGSVCVTRANLPSLVNSVTLIGGKTKNSNNITYKWATYKQLQALALYSNFCSQQVDLICQAVSLLANGQIQLLDVNGNVFNKQWTGITMNEDSVGCMCNTLNTCGGNAACRCDLKSNATSTEGGLIFRRDILPITGVQINAITSLITTVAKLTYYTMECGDVPFNLPKDCDAAGSTRGTGEVTILPCQSTNLSPIDVYCNMNGGTQKNVRQTIIPTKMDTVAVTSNLVINYPSGNFTSIRKLVNCSSQCKQYVRFNSNGATLSGKFTFVGANDQVYNYFPGGSQGKFCPCTLTSSCAALAGDSLDTVKSRQCNSDTPLPQGEARQPDIGFVADRNILPIKSIQYTGSAEEAALATWTVGPVICANSAFDVNECEENLHECNSKALCTNTDSGYTCKCNAGWQGLGGNECDATGRSCVDDNECNLGKCPVPGSTCVNLPGDYYCNCTKGFRQVNNYQCQDINECASNLTNTCDANAQCMNTIGSYLCMCNYGYRGSGQKGDCIAVSGCTCFGDPHCVTFDKNVTHYQGSCKYTIARDNCKAGLPNGPPRFEVIQKNWKRYLTTSTVTWAKEITLLLTSASNITTTILLKQKKVVVIDGYVVYLPYQGNGFLITLNGDNVRITTNLSMELSWNGADQVEVVVSNSYKTKVCGLCGNYDNIASNDWIIGPQCSPAGKQTSIQNLFGDSWRRDDPVDSDPNCKAICSVTDDKPCTGMLDTQGAQKCSSVISRFSACAAALTAAKIDPNTIFTPALSSCKYDYCALGGNDSVLCSLAEYLAGVCQNQVYVKVNYRDSSFCNVQCGKNMVYKTCRTPVATCLNQNSTSASSNPLCDDGCQCIDGYVMEDGQCIEPKQCGCAMSDQDYLPVNANKTNADCTEIWECKAPLQSITKTSFQCDKNAQCLEQEGIHGCYCNLGYSGNGKVCDDIDECDTPTNKPCDPNANCVNTIGSYTCTCKSGFQGDGKTCSDIDECKEAPGVCKPTTEECLNSIGNYSCLCSPGFMRSNTTGNCEDKDECKLGCNSCDLTSTECNNIIGSYNCSCRSGYTPNAQSPFKCDDINECVIADLNKCEPNSQVCVNTAGGYSCICKGGYHPQDDGCVDIDECKTGDATCFGDDTICKNKPGSYDCICADKTLSCKGPNPCLGVNCTKEHTICQRGSCVCDKGFTLNSTTQKCDDIDECVLKTDDCGNRLATCFNLEGSYTCQCINGYEMDDKTKECKNIDECAIESYQCNKNAKCVDTEGAYYCECAEGYTGHCDECRDIDECAVELNKCDKNHAECINTDGSYSCKCHEGFIGDGEKCIDEDECATGKSNCSEIDNLLTCANTPGGFECKCQCGYGWNKEENKCTDINECLNSFTGCHKNAKCINLEGSHKCECKHGFSGDGKSCDPKDDYTECGDLLCPPNSQCVNEACTCLPGFNFSDSQCVDVNECLRHPCSSNAVCENIIGSFTCSCNDGYCGNGQFCDPIITDACIDADFCKGGNCKDGKCTCKKGFELIANECVDINECLNSENNNCTNSLCENIDGGYQCKCHNGFKKTRNNEDGSINCEDINECDEGCHECKANSECRNLYGSYHCYCREGFYDVNGDQSWCEDVKTTSDCDDDCPQGSVCKNKKCECLSGFTASKSNGKLSCTKDTKACNEKSCPAHSTCQEKCRGYSCQCDEGFEKVGNSCEDVNECARDTHNCKENEACSNTDGSYDCVCKAGFKRDENSAKCVATNRCVCSSNGHCENDKCICDVGYRLNNKGQCVDINECEVSKPCHQNADCFNSPGSFSCKCKDHYSGDPYHRCDLKHCENQEHLCDEDTEKCEDTNDGYKCNKIECDDDEIVIKGICRPKDLLCSEIECSQNAVCVVSNNKAICQCSSGYKGDGKNCEDVNECRDASVTNACPPSSTCINHRGGYECRCLSGFKKTENNTCQDINECLESPRACAENAKCNNTEGGYSCTCNDGYQGNGKVSCEVDSKCQRLGGCHEKAFCQLDDNGLFNCQCRQGYTGNGWKSCEKRDACSDLNGNSCHALASCVKGKGDEYKCVCKKGFVGNGRTCCDDVNECLDSSAHNCTGKLQRCINLNGGFSCDCQFGSRKKSDDKCEDIDECSNKTLNDCSPNAKCTNTEGGYNCDCKNGYYGDGKTCNDINECALGIGKCPPDQYCNNTLGGFDCLCKFGAIKNLTSCIQVNPCDSPDNNQCDPNAKCTPKNNGYQCECKSGYVGNGYYCFQSNPCDKLNACPANSKCTNKNNNATCECLTGTLKVLNINVNLGFLCVPINECVNLNNPVCTLLGQRCVDLLDGYRCECAPGFVRNGSQCTDVDECDSSSGSEEAKNCISSGGICTNTVGGWSCTCPILNTSKGLISGAVSTVKCLLVNECTATYGICGDNAKCTDKIFGYSCSCNEGFTRVKNSCVDVDECKTGANLCDKKSTCVNTNGSYICNCPPGYRLDTIGYYCTDINECIDNPLICGEYGKCSNSEGSYSCQCIRGFKLVNNKCEDINECENSTEICHKKANCENLPGSCRCNCQNGYEGDGKICIESDSCPFTALPHGEKCPTNTYCKMVDGKPKCLCVNTFASTGIDCSTGVCIEKCSDIDECVTKQAKCHEKAKCTNTNGAFVCKCFDGYEGDGKTCCDEINECERDNEKRCDSKVSTCRKLNNTNGGAKFTCDCFNGYEKVPGTETCIDINECLEDDACQPNAKCINTNGSHVCDCEDGFRLNSNKQCDDIDECKECNDCRLHTSCRNTNGSYSCDCLEGFNKYNSTTKSCEDIDECLNPFICNEKTNSECFNTPGSYRCNCLNGYKENANGTACDDIDECESVGNVAVCQASATCVNTDGGYKCQCKSGYRQVDNYTCEPASYCMSGNKCKVNNGPSSECYSYGSDYRCTCGDKGFETCDESPYKCIDVDECKTNRHNCTLLQVCINTIGSFQCKCNPGLSFNGTECVDIDECQEAQINGSPLCLPGNCSNFVGGFTCNCPDGFSYNNSKCQDIDECAFSEYDSRAPWCVKDSNAWCKNWPGNFSCTCKDGFSLDSTTNKCVDINECKFANACPNAKCQNVPGSYKCICENGYKENENKQCVDIDECADNGDTCGDPSKGSCVNLPGSYLCSCNSKSQHAGDSNTSPCINLNECELNMTAKPNAVCKDLDDGFDWECKDGYREDDMKICRDIDECIEGPFCPENAECKNTDGSFECHCKYGYRHASADYCEPICSPKSCAEYQTCQVTGEDSYTCSCTCIDEKCFSSGAVCDTEGKSYESYKKLFEYGCLNKKVIEFNYFGQCKKSCADVNCPQKWHCELNNGGLPQCVCDKQCTDEDLQPEKFCSSLGFTFNSRCQNIKRTCKTGIDDPKVYDGPCKRPIPCKLSEWGAWSACSTSCEVGVKTRKRAVLKQALFNGTCDFELNEKEQCYTGPCPGGKCETANCSPLEECSNGQCICPRCISDESDPVCGQIGGVTKSYRSLCQLKLDACQQNKPFVFIHKGKCGEHVPDQPEVCAVVQAFREVNDTYNCVSTQPLEVNICSGGCGTDPKICCHVTAYSQTRALFRCPDNKTKYKDVKIIAKCECIKKSTYVDNHNDGDNDDDDHDENDDDHDGGKDHDNENDDHDDGKDHGDENDDHDNENDDHDGGKDHDNENDDHDGGKDHGDENDDHDDGNDDHDDEDNDHDNENDDHDDGNDDHDDGKDNGDENDDHKDDHENKKKENDKHS